MTNIRATFVALIILIIFINNAADLEYRFMKVKKLFHRGNITRQYQTNNYLSRSFIYIVAAFVFLSTSCSGTNETIVEENENYKIIIESNGNNSVDAIEKSYYIIDKKTGSRSIIISDTCNSTYFRVPATTRCLPKDSIMSVRSARMLNSESSSGFPKVLVESSNNNNEILSYIVSLDSDSVLLLPANNGYIGQTDCEGLLILENLKPYMPKNDSVQFSELIAFDELGTIISRMEAKAYKNCSREFILADKHFDKITSRAFQYGNFSYQNTKLPYRFTELFTHRDDAPSLIVFLHGLDAVGTDNEKQLKWDMIRNIYRYLAQKDQHAIILAPQIPVGNWDAMATKVKALIDNIIDAENVDRSRIYICGYSLGAKGTWSMIQKYPNFFAGALSAGSPSTPLTNADQYSRTLSTPIWAGNGSAEKDATAQMNRLRQMGADVKYSYKREWGHGEACSSVFNDECFDWLFSHVKK